MKAKQTYLKGTSVFYVSLLVILVMAITTYLTGINHHRSISTNFYFTLSIIALALFLFMSYGLYKGIGLINNLPRLQHFKKPEILDGSEVNLSLPDIDFGDDIAGILFSIIVWIVMSIAVIFLLIFLEAFFWYSLFTILTMLYWVFFRALKLVFSKKSETQGKLNIAMLYALLYTVRYTCWIFGIVYFTEITRNSLV